MNADQKTPFGIHSNILLRFSSQENKIGIGNIY